MSTCDAALLHVQQECKCEWNRLMFSHQCSQIKVWPNRTEKCVFQETAGQSHLDLWPPNSDHLICKNQVSASSANVRYFNTFHACPSMREKTTCFCPVQDVLLVWKHENGSAIGHLVSLNQYLDQVSWFTFTPTWTQAIGGTPQVFALLINL